MIKLADRKHKGVLNGYVALYSIIRTDYDTGKLHIMMIEDGKVYDLIRDITKKYPRDRYEYSYGINSWEDVEYDFNEWVEYGYLNAKRCVSEAPHLYGG